MMNHAQRKAATRLLDQAREWDVAIHETFETATSSLALGVRGDEHVVLKVVRSAGDEWHSGEVMQAFGGRGMARALACVPGAILIERLRPGTSLASLSQAGRDDEATDVLADVIEAMSPDDRDTQSPTVADWGQAFSRHALGGNRSLPQHLVDRASEMFDRLAQTQARPRLLHGDLQHYNVLFDRFRGWLAIDPKGVIGEREYEIGALLRNPVGEPELFAQRAVIERRVNKLATRLGIDTGRTLSWAFAQAVLSAIWSIEDGDAPEMCASPLRLAEVLSPMIP